MSDVGELSVGAACEPPLLHTVEEAAELLRIGRTLAYALTHRYEESGGREGLPVVRLGGCVRVPRWALLELALNGRTVPLGELVLPPEESRARLDSELAGIDRLGREVEPDLPPLNRDRADCDRRPHASSDRHASAPVNVEQLSLIQSS
jgi:hypothetical protein